MRDSAGNWSATASASITLDLTPPTAPRFDEAPYSPLNSVRPRWTWHSGGGGARVYRVRVDATDMTGAPERPDSSYTQLENLAEGRHIIYVQERDAAGNWSPSASKVTVVAMRREVGTFYPESPAQFAFVSNSQGTVLLAYNDWSSTGPKPAIQRFTGTEWERISSPEAYGHIDNSNSVALSQSGVPYIVVSDSLSRKTILRYTGTQWQPIANPFFSTDDGEVALAISNTDILYVAFVDASNTNNIIVRRLNGQAWENVGARGVTSPHSCMEQPLRFQIRALQSSPTSTTASALQKSPFRGSTLRIIHGGMSGSTRTLRSQSPRLSDLYAGRLLVHLLEFRRSFRPRGSLQVNGVDGYNWGTRYKKIAATPRIWQ